MLSRNISAAAAGQRIEQGIFGGSRVDCGRQPIGAIAFPERLYAVPDAPEIDFVKRACRSQIGIEYTAARAADPGIVDDDVTASVLGPCEFGKRLDRRGIGDIADQKFGIDA